MELLPMRFKDYTWPHNPKTYLIQYERKIGIHKIPFGRYYLQDLGPSCRVLKGQGEFFGNDAYPEFKKLASVFYSDGPGMLIHPVWQAANAYFTQLSLTQKPQKNYVQYSFTFYESFDEYNPYLQSNSNLPSDPSASTSSSSGNSSNLQTDSLSSDPRVYTVQKGDSFWKIARQFQVDLSDLIRWNPQIKNPNLIYPGEEVYISQ